MQDMTSIGMVSEGCAVVQKFPTVVPSSADGGYHELARGVAQLGRAPALGAGGRRFKSCRPDFRKSRRSRDLRDTPGRRGAALTRPTRYPLDTRTPRRTRHADEALFPITTKAALPAGALSSPDRELFPLRRSFSRCAGVSPAAPELLPLRRNFSRCAGTSPAAPQLLTVRMNNSR
jgi:hypothetical protein